MVNISPPQTSWEMSMWRFHSTCQAKISHQSPWIIWKNVEVMFAGNIPKNILVAWDFSSLAQTIPEKKLHFYSSGEFHWMMKSGKFCPWFYLRLYVFQIWTDIQWHPSVATGLPSNSLMAPSLGHWLSSVAIVGEMMPSGEMMPYRILRNQESPYQSPISLKTARLASTLTVSSVIYGETTWLITSGLWQLLNFENSLRISFIKMHGGLPWIQSVQASPKDLV